VKLLQFSSEEILEHWKELELAYQQCGQAGKFASLFLLVEEYRNSSNPNKREAVKRFELSGQHVSGEKFSTMSVVNAAQQAATVMTWKNVSSRIVRPVLKIVRDAAEAGVVRINQAGQAVVSTVRSVNNPYASAAHMVSSAKQLSHVLGWLIVGQPIVAAAAITTWSIKQDSCSGRRYLPQVLDGGAANNGKASWENLYPHVNQVICEAYDQLRENGGVLSEDIQKYFFWYLRNRSTNSAENQIELSAESIDKLRHIIGSLIHQYAETELLLQRPGACSEWEDVLVVWEPYLREKDSDLLEKVINAAIKKRNLAYVPGAEAFAIELVRTVGHYLSDPLVSARNVLVLLSQMRIFVLSNTPWNVEEPTTVFRLGLNFFIHQRRVAKQRDVFTAARICGEIDQSVQDIIKMGCAQIPKRSLGYTMQLLQEDVWMQYVQHLELQDRAAFNGLYRVVDPRQILPKVERAHIPAESGFSDLKITIHHCDLSSTELEQLVAQIKQQHQNMNVFMRKFTLYSATGVGEESSLIVYVFRNKFYSLRYRGLFSKRTPAEILEEAFLYKDQEKEEEKHEISRAMVYTLLGQNAANGSISYAFITGLIDCVRFGTNSTDPVRMSKLNERLKSKESDKIKSPLEMRYSNSNNYFFAQYMFCTSQDLENSRSLFTGLQQGKSKKESDALLEQYKQQEAEPFTRWLTELTALSKNYRIPDTQRSGDANSLYRMDIKQSKQFSHFINSNGGMYLQVFFRDTIFTMRQNDIARHWETTEESTLGGGVHQTQPMSVYDYNWFMNSLLRGVFAQMFLELAEYLPSDETMQQRIIQSILGGNESSEFFNRQIISIKSYNASSVLVSDSVNAIPAELTDFVCHSAYARKKWLSIHPRMATVINDCDTWRTLLRLQVLESHQYKAALMQEASSSNITSFSRSLFFSTTTEARVISTATVTAESDTSPPSRLYPMVSTTESTAISAVREMQVSNSTLLPHQNFSNEWNVSTRSEIRSSSGVAGIVAPVLVAAAVLGVGGGIAACFFAKKWRTGTNVSTRENARENVQMAVSSPLLREDKKDISLPDISSARDCRVSSRASF